MYNKICFRNNMLKIKWFNIICKSNTMLTNNMFIFNIILKFEMGKSHQQFYLLKLNLFISIVLMLKVGILVILSTCDMIVYYSQQFYSRYRNIM